MVKIIKLLIVVDSLSIGGVQTTLINLLKTLEKDNELDITLLPLVDDGQLISAIPNNIKVIHIAKKSQILLKPIRKLAKSFKLFTLLKVLKYYLPKHGKMQDGENIRYNVINSLENCKEEYDVAIAYTDSSSLFYVSEKVKARRKYVWVHMDYTEKNNRPMFHNEFYEKMDKIVCVSVQAKKSFDNLNNHLSNKTIVIHNTFDVEKIDNLKNEEVKEFNHELFNIVTVGRLSKEKNFLMLIRAYYKSKSFFNKKTMLYIVGDGIEYKNLKKEIALLNLSNECILLGAKTNPYKYMNKCDLYVQTSIREGFGMTLYEASYLKKPILSTKVAAVNELFKNNDALIVDNNLEDISQGLIKLVNNDAYRNELCNRHCEEKNIDDKEICIRLIKGI